MKINFFNWKKEKQTDKIEVPEGHKILWVISRDGQGRMIKETTKWVTVNPLEYNLNIKLFPDYCVSGIMDKKQSPIITDSNYDDSILKYLVKFGEEDKLDDYIVLTSVQYFMNRAYIKNTDKYFQLHLRNKTFSDIYTRKGLPYKAKEMDRTEAENYIYKSTEERKIDTFEFAVLTKVNNRKNTFRIKCLDIDEIYELSSFKNQKIFEERLKDFNLTIDKKYWYEVNG